MQIPVKSNIAHVVALALRQQYTLIVEMLNVRKSARFSW